MDHSSSEEPDLCIIGAGGAGFELAMAGAALGLRVVVIERDMGDESLRNGDLALEVFREAGRRSLSDPFGAGSVEFARVHAHLLAALRSAGPDRRLARLAAMNLRLIRATASFADERTILAGDERLRPRRTVIATGTVAQPDRAGVFEATPEFTSDRLDLLSELPGHLLVSGSDASALAIGQSLGRLGSAVTILSADGLQSEIDPELFEPLLGTLRCEGVVFDAPASPPSHILVAGRRRVAIDDLGLGRAGIRTRAGALELSSALQTSNPRVYAIGDVTGSDSLAAAQAQIGVVLRSAFFRLPARYRPDLVPRIVNTDPAIATVGASEAEARRAGPVSIHRWPFAETDRGRASGNTTGHVKIVADRAGRVRGAGIVGTEARELIAFWTLAISRGATLGQLGTVAGSRFTFAEASRRAVMAHVAGRLANPWLKRVLALVRRLG